MNETTIREVAILQNPALGALLLHACVSEYERNGNHAGPTLPKLMPVLPMLYHAETARTISTMAFKGGLMRFLRSRGAPTLGLRHRTAAMADQTFQALALCFSAGLLDFDAQTGVVMSRAVGTLPQLSDDVEIKRMMAASRRLGRWFSEITLTEMCVHLDLTF